MDVDVENGLPAGRPVGLEQCHAIGAEALLKKGGDVVDRFHEPSRVVAPDIPDVGGMPAREDKSVPGHGRGPVQDGDGVLVLVDQPRPLFPCHNPAENTFRCRVSHARIVQDRGLNRRTLPGRRASSFVLRQK